jgi:biopolymer transport protein ExbD
MKKCSKSAHESMTEMNITPLLDLAFVLLVIFIITTTPIVNDLDLTLPKASRHEKDPPKKPNFITVDSAGKVYFARVPEANLPHLLSDLLAAREADPDLSIIVRGDAKTKYKEIREVMDICQQANVVKVELATEAADKPASETP